MSLINEAKQKLGETFLIGFEGTELSDDTSAFLSQARIGGVILFAKNYKSPEQVANLINQIQECKTDLPLWTSVDQEGGRVQRFKDPFTLWPSGHRISTKSTPKVAFEISEAIAKELKAVGINLNFTPVADIFTNPKNEVIGDRAFGTDEETVTKYVTAIVRGHVKMGVQPCVKHFPGHGDTLEDSHFALPRVDTPLETLRERELKPFVRAFKSRCSMVMSAHIINSTIDPKLPATFSTKTLKAILRDEMRYSKIILSDDLEMQAITDHFGAEEAPVMALNATCDILIYRTEGAARKGYEAVMKALESGKIEPERILEAAKRSHELKTEYLNDYRPRHRDDWKFIGSPDHRSSMEKLLQGI